MKIAARELLPGDVVASEVQAVTDVELLAAHVRVYFADGQSRSYELDAALALICSQLAACPKETCSAQTCICPVCDCRVCRRRAAIADGAPA